MESSLLANQVSEELQCAICCDTLRTPKTLPCLHSFCKSCLEDWSRQSVGPLSCPECRLEVSNNVDALPTNFKLEKLSKQVADFQSTRVQQQSTGAGARMNERSTSPRQAEHPPHQGGLSQIENRRHQHSDQYLRRLEREDVEYQTRQRRQQSTLGEIVHRQQQPQHFQQDEVLRPPQVHPRNIQNDERSQPDILYALGKFTHRVFRRMIYFLLQCIWTIIMKCLIRPTLKFVRSLVRIVFCVVVLWMLIVAILFINEIFP